ncbi:MAG: protein kinase domain-containing protein [Myxococcota bacterium]
MGERYLVKEKIGAGAAGSVYRARDTILCDRVAVKLVSLEDAASSNDARSTLERVEMEVRAVASISHPHLVRFVDFIEIGDTHAGIVTDFVDGETLGEVLEREGPLSVERVLDIAIQVAMAIGAMHDRHIVHRDLKPANIIIEQLPGQGDYSQVIDFGIVRYADEVARTNAFLGTPLYASPEQVTNGPIDHRADVYSLGAIMFEMLTGRPPFDEQKAFKALMAHARAEPPTLSDVAPERELPRWLETLVADMLEKDPDGRIQTMAGVVRRLRSAEVASPIPNPQVASMSLGATDETLVYLGGESEVFQSKHCPQSESELIWDVGADVSALAVGEESVIAGTRLGTVEMFEMHAGESRTLFASSGRDEVTSVAVARDGSIVAGFQSGRVFMTHRPDLDRAWTALPEGESVKSVAISSESGAVLVLRDDDRSEVYILERSRRKPSLVLEYEEPVERIDFSGDGFLIGAKSADGNLEIYSIVNGVMLTEEHACPYSASPDRAACPKQDECSMVQFED